MTTKEHREVHSTRTVSRTLSPSSGPPRAVTPQEFDNNLDYLLEDLQNSVSRPGSSLEMNGHGGSGSGSYHREYSSTRTVSGGGGKSGSLDRGGRVEYLSAANPTTVALEEKTLDGKQKTIFKTSTYEYNETMDDAAVPTDSQIRMQSNINQLDTLLDDLQQARKGANINAGIDPGLLEPLDTSIPGGTTRQVTTKKTVQRELVYDPPLTGSSRPSRAPRQPSPMRREDREGSVTREITYNINENTYGRTRPLSPNRQAQTLQKTNIQTYTNVQDPTPTTVITKEEALNPVILAELDPNLLPNPSTKVTTTIKTYTYEIPGTGYPSSVSPRVQSPTNERYIYNVSPNQNIPPQPVKNETILYKNENYQYQHVDSPPPVNQTIIYKEDTRKTTNTYGQPISPNDPPVTYHSPNVPKTEKIIYKHDTHTATNTYGQPDYPNQQTYGLIKNTPPSQPAVNQTIIYKHDTRTSTNTYGQPDPNYPNSAPYTGLPNQPPNQIIYREQTTNTNYTPQSPPQNTTIIYKHNTHTTNEVNRGPNYPNNDYPSRGYPQNEGYPPNDGYPKKPKDVNIVYKHTTHHTTTNNYKGYPNPTSEDSQPLLQPGRFPTNDQPDGGPPKRLDDLLAEFGTERVDTNNVYNSTTYPNKSAASPRPGLGSGNGPNQQAIVEKNEKKDIKDLPKSRNIAGPPVYYPPGHEMFAKKEESLMMQQSSSGGGGYMKAKGKYEYEAGSKSKSKSSSSKTVVPVCLPLCCAMPCTII